MIVLEPQNRKIAKDFFPFGLVFLSVILTCVLLTIQINDNNYRNDVIHYYFQNDLDKIEFPLYVKFIRQHMRNDYYFIELENIQHGKVSDMEMYWMLSTDPFFQRCLDSDKCLSPSTLTFLKWQDKRREYLYLLDDISFYKYGFKPAAPSVLTLFTNLVINTDLYQFIINLLFLIAVGAIVEEKIGIIGLLLSYILCASSMTSIYSLMVPLSLIPVSGVSGGVAGLLGMMLVYSRFRTVRLLYFNFHEFRTKEIQSLYVLLLWLLCQSLLVYLTGIDIVDFISQNVALMVGILLAYLMKNISLSRKPIKRRKERSDDLHDRLNEAVNEIQAMNYNEAKKILYPLLDEYPTNKEIYFQLFSIIKSNPASEEYHDIAQKIFLIKDSSRSTVTMINLVFKNYVKRAQPTIRFDVNTFFGLVQRFRKAGFYEDAEKILKVLTKHDSSGNLSELLAREQLLLARCYFLNKDKVHGDRLLEWLVDTFPNTESAKQAKSFVDMKNSGSFL